MKLKLQIEFMVEIGPHQKFSPEHLDSPYYNSEGKPDARVPLSSNLAILLREGFKPAELAEELKAAGITLETYIPTHQNTVGGVIEAHMDGTLLSLQKMQDLNQLKQALQG